MTYTFFREPQEGIRGICLFLSCLLPKTKDKEGGSWAVTTENGDGLEFWSENKYERQKMGQDLEKQVAQSHYNF